MSYNEPQSDSLYSDRKELKFIADIKDLDTILEVLEKHLKPYYPTKDTDYVLLSSVYMDSPDLKFLWEHLNESPDKRKIRLRQYGPNGKWDSEKYIEIKYRNDGAKKKCRLCVDAQSTVFILGGKEIPSSNRKLNQDLPESEYTQAKSLIQDACKDGVNPVVAITYSRLSYKGDGIRVTVDRDLKTKSFATLDQYDAEKIKSSAKWSDFEKTGQKYVANKIVIEVKLPVDSDIPDWLDSLVSKYASGEDEPFSKYVYGLYKELE